MRPSFKKLTVDCVSVAFIAKTCRFVAGITSLHDL
jgi:hypothetical protein